MPLSIGVDCDVHMDEYVTEFGRVRPTELQFVTLIVNPADRSASFTSVAIQPEDVHLTTEAFIQRLGSPAMIRLLHGFQDASKDAK